MFIFDSDIDSTDDMDSGIIGRGCSHINNRKDTSIIVVLTPRPVAISIGSDHNVYKR